MWEHQTRDWLKSGNKGKTWRVQKDRLKAAIDRWERGVAEATPVFTQCLKVIRKYGGIIPFSVSLGVTPDHVLKFWLSSTIKVKTYNQAGYDKTSGLIPTPYLALAIRNARHFGILLTADDIYPDFVQNGTVRITKDYARWLKHINAKTQAQRRLEHRLASVSSA